MDTVPCCYHSNLASERREENTRELLLSKESIFGVKAGNGRDLKSQPRTGFPAESSTENKKINILSDDPTGTHNYFPECHLGKLA